MSPTNGRRVSESSDEASPSPPTATRGLASAMSRTSISSSTSSRPQPQRSNSLDPAIPDEAPPSYDAAISMSNSDTRLDTGPSHMDFSGPPPMPDRPPQPLQHTATGGVVLPGVGVGYGTHAPPPQHPSHGYAASAHSGYPGAATAAQPAHRPPPPPQQQQQQNSGPQDHSPTESPTPGRPLLRGGKLLVYPPGHKCSKCGNTGYKNNDTSNPCSSDWRKYGKAYGSALAASYAGGATPAANFQKPLPALRPAASSRPPQQQHHQQQQQYRPPPPQQYRPPPPIQYAPHGVPMPQNALYVQPGDPRIGGTLCRRCGGRGREIGGFLFIEEFQCSLCRGLGRVFP